jgi:hypothetical protein
MSWVCGHLTGGLGNRLFQHVAAMGLAERWNRECVFYLPQCAPTQHGPFANIFSLFPETKIIQEDTAFTSIPEPPGHVFTYTELPEEPLPSNVSVDGWRQTSLYFPKKPFTVQLERNIIPSIQEQLLQQYHMVSEEQKKSTWFIHIRLGDYAILPHHQIDVGTYVSRAAQHIPKEAMVLVFSDEAVKYKTMLEDFCKAIGIQGTVVQNEDELQSLYLMSQCWGGAIVANSTFSWWGAYLARQRCPNPSQYMALYPTVWGSGLPPARDVVPSWGLKVSWQ